MADKVAVLGSVIPRAVAAQIIVAARATDGSDQALDALAMEHGLLLSEVRALVARARQTPAAAKPTPAATGTNGSREHGTRPSRGARPAGAEREAVQPATRVCSQCGVEQPIGNFYEQAAGRDGRMAACISCNNSRPPTENRMVRNRARTRAYIALAKAHALEFAELYDAELEKAREEHRVVAAAATEAGYADAPVARLRPGPKRKGEQVADRLDVARCAQCHTHHDADHECPSCGDTTPETAPVVKPWVIRAWAVEQGLDVPTRGPIPDAVQAAYDDAHQNGREDEAS